MDQMGQWLQKNLGERIPAASASRVSSLNWEASHRSCGGRRKTELDKHPGLNCPTEP